MNHLLSSVEQTRCWYDGVNDLFTPIPVMQLSAIGMEFCVVVGHLTEEGIS